jgi:hypothetical protein
MRYVVKAKRRGTNEPWSEWTLVNDYYRAMHHLVKCETIGYDAELVIKEPAVEELWKLLSAEGDVKEHTDAILDAGFRKEIVVAKEIFAKINELLNAIIESLEEEKDTAREEDQPELLMRCIADLRIYMQVKTILDVIENKYVGGKQDEM